MLVLSFSCPQNDVVRPSRSLQRNQLDRQFPRLNFRRTVLQVLAFVLQVPAFVLQVLAFVAFALQVVAYVAFAPEVVAFVCFLLLLSFRLLPL